MYNWLMTIASIVVAVMGMYHSYLFFKTKDFAVKFFVTGFVFGILRENLVQMIASLYYYPGYFIYIGKAPLLLGFGWSVAFYIGLFLSKDVFLYFNKDLAENIIALAIGSAIIAGFLGFAIEVTAVQVDWWVWLIEPFYMGMPLIVPFGWAGGALIFVFTYLYVDSRNWSENKKLLTLVALAPVMIAVHLGYVFLVRGILTALGFM